MNAPDMEDAEWQDLLDSHIQEELQKRTLLRRAVPLLCALGGLALPMFILEARFSHVLQERVSVYARANNPVGVFKAQFKRWIARKKYPVLGETSRQVTIAIWGRDVGMSHHYFMADDAAKISANFDTRSRLVAFGRATKTTIGWEP